MYIANHYVHHKGQLYKRGECIEGLSEDQVAWLLKVGAITQVAPVSVAETVKAEEAPEPEKPAPAKRTKKKGVKANESPDA